MDALFAQPPEPFAQRDGGLGVADAVARQVLPGPADGLLHDQVHGFGRGVVRLGIIREGGLVAGHHLLQHVDGDDARQVRPAGGAGQGQAQADQVVRGVADHALVEVADLYLHPAVAVRHRAEVADAPMPVLHTWRRLAAMWAAMFPSCTGGAVGNAG